MKKWIAWGLVMVLLVLTIPLIGFFYPNIKTEALTSVKKIIHSESAPKAIGPYEQAIQTGGMVFTSGQVGIDMATGELAEGIEKQTHCAMKNLGAILAQAGAGYPNVVKTTVYVKDMADFATVNKIYESYFEGVFPARSCVQVAALPMGGLIEIECIAILGE